jgi:hypothetical protein
MEIVTRIFFYLFGCLLSGKFEMKMLKKFD